MKGGGSRNKGNIFELVIAKYLSNLTGSKFNRVPASGAFGTKNKLKNNIFLGDVFTEDIRFCDVVIECKSYSTLSFSDLFNKGSKFYKWIAQSKREAKDKKWLLFIKLNRNGVFVVRGIKTSPCSIENMGIKAIDSLELNKEYLIRKIEEK